MNKIDRLINNKLFISCMERIDAYETDRIFCRHGLDHSLDVARIGYIFSIDNNISVEREVIYAAALLHDIGRCSEYEGGEPHSVSGARIAKRLLAEAGFSEKDTDMICDAIACHKDESDETVNPLRRILYRADKLSRNCFCCRARSECYWDDEKKNKGIVI